MTVVGENQDVVLHNEAPIVALGVASNVKNACPLIVIDNPADGGAFKRDTYVTADES